MEPDGIEGISGTDSTNQAAPPYDPEAAQFGQVMAASKAEGRIQLAQALPVQNTPPASAPAASPVRVPTAPPPEAPPPNNVIQFPRLPGAAGGGAAVEATEGAGLARGAGLASRLLPLAGPVAALSLALPLRGDTPSVYPVSVAGFPELSGEHDIDTNKITISQKTGWFSSETLTTLDLKPGGGGEVLGVNGQQVGSYDGRTQTLTLSPAAQSELDERMQRGVPGDQQLSTTGYRTRKAMENATSDPCRNYDGQRHHMTPAQLMQPNKNFLRKIGFSLDDGLLQSTGQSNMIRLPTNNTQRNTMKVDPLCGDRTIHSGSHPEYTKAVNDRIEMISRQFNQGRISADQARAKMSNLLQALQRQLTSGQYTTMSDPRLINAIRTMSF
jgi:hypothetical protein